MDSATTKWLCFSGKREDLATWNIRFIAYIQNKNLLETLAGTAVKPVEPAALGTLRQLSRERLIELQQRNLKTIRRNSEITKTHCGACWL